MKKISKISLIVISLFLFISCADALDEYKYIKEERIENNNFGVKKKWQITPSNKDNVLNTPYVDETIKVYDFADILTDHEEETLRNFINEFTDKYNTELIILTSDLPYNYDSENETYAVDFYDYNSFGINYDNYDGIVLFRNTYFQNPYYNIYTFGKAQTYFDNARYDYILDSIYDQLHGKMYLSGFTSFINQVKSFYEQGVPSSMRQYKIDENGFLIKKYNPPILAALIISGVVTAIVIGVLINKNKMVKKATSAGSYLDKKSIQYNKIIDQFIGTHTTHHTISTSSGGSGGMHSSAGSSGGGHSSGGGRHG